MRKKIALFLAFFFFSPLAWARPVTKAVSSPLCDEAQIRKIVGKPLLSLEKRDWGGGLVGFILTLESNHMTFDQLTQAMIKAHCFRK